MSSTTGKTKQERFLSGQWFYVGDDPYIYRFRRNEPDTDNGCIVRKFEEEKDDEEFTGDITFVTCSVTSWEFSYRVWLTGTKRSFSVLFKDVTFI